MSEKSNERTVFSLLEVTGSIRKTLNERYKSSFWVKAEMNKLNFYKHSGHCYPELVEKRDSKVIAQIRSVLWKDDYERINQNFQTVLKESLKDGIKILFLAKIQFDPIYGISLTILDIDPAYTLGDLEKEKLDTINLLKANLLFDKNKQLKIPILPQRIAIISVETSKGYADFINVIDKNPWLYKFFHLLFPALLQGDNAASDITAQLRIIAKVVHHFDVVAIIRGGGGDVGLSCYNDYELAKAICDFPIPVITGIGHATNETVAEMISFANAITPTKLAEYLIQKFHNFSVPLREAERKIVEKSKRLVYDERMKFQSEIKLFKSVTESILSTNKNDLKNISRYLLQETQFRFRYEREYLQNSKLALLKGKELKFKNSVQKLSNFALVIGKDTFVQLKQESAALKQILDKLRYSGVLKVKQNYSEIQYIDKQIKNMSPTNVLRRGYSITALNGKAVTDVSEVKNGDVMSTTLFKGKIISIVESTENKSTNE